MQRASKQALRFVRALLGGAAAQRSGDVFVVRGKDVHVSLPAAEVRELMTHGAIVGDSLACRANEGTAQWLKRQMLDADAFEGEAPTVVDLDTPRHRAVARKLAEQSLVLLSNDGVLPLAASAKRVAVIGPNADRAEALQGCYSFANHVLAHHPDHEIGFEIPTVREALVEALPDAEIVVARGCDVEGEDRSGFEEAAAAASAYRGLRGATRHLISASETARESRGA